MGLKKFALVACMIPAISLISTRQVSAKTVVTYAAGSQDKVGYTESIYLYNQLYVRSDVRKDRFFFSPCVENQLYVAS